MPRVAGDQETEQRFFRTLKHDVGRLTTDVQKAGFKGTVGTTFRELREFYLTTQLEERLARMGRIKRAFYFAWWLLKALVLKLTPARRLLLLAAAFFLSQGSGVVTSGDRFRLTVDVGWIGVLLVVFVLMLELKDKLVAREELEAGRAVQMALMPHASPVLPGWQVWLFTRPANDVGGDLVDYLRIDDRRACVVLGDVAGKGLPAALLMAKLQATLRALAPAFTSMAEIGGRLNEILHRDGLPNRFATLIYLEVSPASGLVRLLNAGHMPPLVLHGAEVTELPRGSLALSLLADAQFGEQAVELLGGDTLVVYSDGVTEAMNERGEFFGDERLKALLPSLAARPVDAAGAAIVGAVDRFVGTARAHDDLSLVVLRRAAGLTQG